MGQSKWKQTEPPVRLTQRQFVLIALYANGATAKLAAAILGIQFGTLHKLLKRVRAKFALAGLPAGSAIELERTLREHPTLVALPDGTERLVQPFAAAQASSYR